MIFILGKKVFLSTKKKETSNPKLQPVQSDEIPFKNYFNYSTIGQAIPIRFHIVFPQQTLNLTTESIKRKREKNGAYRYLSKRQNHISHSSKEKKKSEHNWNFPSVAVADGVNTNSDAKKKFRALVNSSIWNILFCYMQTLQWSKNHFLFARKFRYTHTHIHVCSKISV